MYPTISTTTSIRLARRTSPVDHQSSPVKVLVNIKSDDGCTFALAHLLYSAVAIQVLGRQGFGGPQYAQELQGTLYVLNAIAIYSKVVTRWASSHVISRYLDL